MKAFIVWLFVPNGELPSLIEIFCGYLLRFFVCIEILCGYLWFYSVCLLLSTMNRFMLFPLINSPVCKFIGNLLYRPRIWCNMLLSAACILFLGQSKEIKNPTTKPHWSLQSEGPFTSSHESISDFTKDQTEALLQSSNRWCNAPMQKTIGHFCDFSSLRSLI